MPIIEIQALRPAEGVDVSQALVGVTMAVAAHLGEDPQGTWALWRPIEGGAYAEGADVPATQPMGTHPAIVDLFAASRDDPAALMAAVGKAVAEAFGFGDGNVVVRLTPAEPDRVSWGD
jgi:phenylpyruvate tautomerase PptA (4-oxalocrotonate tautomerase family)